MKQPIYLDYNATTPIDSAVSQAMLPYIHHIFGNPSSSHAFGVSARQAVENARKQVAELLKCQIDEILFTSGGSESNNMAIKGVALANREKGNHLITSQIEHPAVSEVCRYLEANGFRVTYLPVDREGLVSVQQLEEAITPHTILISIMHANNEVGTIQPIPEIARIAHRHRILFHSDCAQSVGKIPVTVPDLGVDLLSIAGHKLYAPKGVGALYVRSGIVMEKFIHGAGQEMNRRAGTENVAEIVGLGKACQLISLNLKSYQAHLRKMRDLIQQKLQVEFPGVIINGHLQHRLPNTLSISFPRLEANTILAELKTVAVSAGAACHSDRIDVSQVLQAMGVPVESAMGTIRISTGRGTTSGEIEAAVAEISQVVKRLQPREKTAEHLPDSGEVKLTRYTHGLGCACKLRPQLLEEVLKKFPVPSDKRVLVGAETADDAAVYRINDNQAIVQTVDFFTPVVDDPYQFGAIAAANSLSDIYAMGATPLFALNIVGFPSNRLPISVLEAILAGAQDKATEAGISIIGGHTVDDTEPKFGMAVTGLVHPEKILRNSGARPGNILILTKPLGTGILSTALKMNLLTPELTVTLVETMSELNKTAGEIISQYAVDACTDITGFGLLGHLLEMMKGSHTSAEIHFEAIPFLPEVNAFITANVIPGGTRDNYNFTESRVAYAKNLSEGKKLMLNDAQTSGGLLIAIQKRQSDRLLAHLVSSGVPATIIGKVIREEKVSIRVV